MNDTSKADLLKVFAENAAAKRRYPACGQKADSGSGLKTVFKKG
jgi:hypothetical protein